MGGRARGGGQPHPEPGPAALILVVTGFVVAARRSNAPWARSYVAFLKLSLVIIVVRILFQALLSTGAQGPTVLFTLPSLPMPEGSGLKLGGVVSLEAVLRAFYEGLQLATILCCVGAANALGSARRLLRYVPGALYEIGVACVIALTFAPQLVTDAARVRAAHRLRGQNGTGLRSLRRLAMPVLEGALERSVDLAAAMDSRGYGRTTDESAASRGGSPALLVFGGLLGVCVGIYGLLDGTASALARDADAAGRPGRRGRRAARRAAGAAAGPATGPTRGRCPSGWSPAAAWSPRRRCSSTCTCTRRTFFLASVTDRAAGAAAGRAPASWSARCRRSSPRRCRWPRRRAAPRRRPPPGRPTGWRWPRDRAAPGRRHVRRRRRAGALRGRPDHPRGRAGRSWSAAPGPARPPCCAP